MHHHCVSHLLISTQKAEAIQVLCLMKSGIYKVWSAKLVSEKSGNQAYYNLNVAKKYLYFIYVSWFSIEQIFMHFRLILLKNAQQKSRRFRAQPLGPSCQFIQCVLDYHCWANQHSASLEQCSHNISTTVPRVLLNKHHLLYIQDVKCTPTYTHFSTWMNE